jgi:hypothetical protein
MTSLTSRVEVFDDTPRTRDSKTTTQWSSEENEVLAAAVGRCIQARSGAWSDVVAELGGTRTNSSCRHRWNVVKKLPGMEEAAAAAAAVLRSEGADEDGMLPKKKKKRITAQWYNKLLRFHLHSTENNRCSRCCRCPWL